MVTTTRRSSASGTECGRRGVRPRCRSGSTGAGAGATARRQGGAVRRSEAAPAAYAALPSAPPSTSAAGPPPDRLPSQGLTGPGLLGLTEHGSHLRAPRGRGRGRRRGWGVLAGCSRDSSRGVPARCVPAAGLLGVLGRAAAGAEGDGAGCRPGAWRRRLRVSGGSAPPCRRRSPVPGSRRRPPGTGDGRPSGRCGSRLGASAHDGEGPALPTRRAGEAGRPGLTCTAVR